MSRHRIAMLAPFALHPKGTTRWRVMPLAWALAAAGHEVRVIAPPYDWPAHSGRRWRDRGVEVVHVRLAGPGRLVFRVAKEALAWQPDVVHCFKPKGYNGLAAWLLTQWRPDLPLVMDADDWEGGWNELAGYSRGWQWLFTRQERWGLGRAKAVTAASRWLADYAAGLRGGAEDVFYLPNGFGGFSCSEEAVSSSVTPRDHGSGGSSVLGAGRVLLYTRFVEHSPEEVWRVWRRVLAAEPGAVLWVAGRGLGGEETRLAELARSAGMTDAVRLLGWIPAVTRAGLFAAMDAALLPVRDTATNRAKCPMRLVDLLAAGVPVATQAVGEYGAYVRHEESGLLARPGDEAGLAGAVLRLLGDETLRARLGAAAARQMAAEFAWPRLAEAALQAYRVALHG